MNPTIVKACVNDQHLQLVNEPLIASGGVNIIQIKFEFCGLWSGCGKTAVFYCDPAKVYHVPIVDDLATVPHEVTADEGCFYFGVVGSASNIRTTEVIKVKVARGAITTATAEPEDPTPDIYQQMMARFDEAIAMRATAGTIYEYNDLIEGHTNWYVVGNIQSTGAKVSIYLDFYHLKLDPGETFEFNLPEGIAPFGDDADLNCLLLTSRGDPGDFSFDNWSPVPESEQVVVAGAAGYLGGPYHPTILITNTGESTVGGTTGCIRVNGVFDLSSVSVAELVDVRVAADGTTYPTAGDAVRALEGKIPSSVHKNNGSYTCITDDQVDLYAGPDDDACVEMSKDGIRIAAHNGVEIQNLVDPVNDTDAVNKKYVDALAQGGGGSSAPCRFVVEYNVTPFEEIEAAYNAGLELQLKQDNLVGCLTLARITEEQSTYDYVQFELFDYNGYMRLVRVTRDNTWEVVNAPYPSLDYVNARIAQLEARLAALEG